MCIRDRYNVEKDEIERFNYEKLESNKQPMALINAIHNCPEASLAKSDDAQGLFAQLRLCKRPSSYPCLLYTSRCV